MLDKFNYFSSEVFNIVKNWQKLAGQVMKDFDLNASQLIYMLALYDHDKLNSQELVKISGKDKSDVSRNLNQMIRSGIVEKKSNKKNNYGGSFYLTEKGRLIGSKISEKTMEYIELANKNISRDKKEIFYEVLGALSENIENLTEEKL
ncbi:MAG: MarR family winged helix-turn-helix transcriptional regulator [Peptoniphilus sp.]|uniref:MarR family winged helix-turn-helix transcriptional regulator n=1 Tax=Peptoniphilus sp. TaxID=1971214 RepID=UPI00399BFEE8